MEKTGLIHQRENLIYGCLASRKLSMDNISEATSSKKAIYAQRRICSVWTISKTEMCTSRMMQFRAKTISMANMSPETKYRRRISQLILRITKTKILAIWFYPKWKKWFRILLKPIGKHLKNKVKGRVLIPTNSSYWGTTSWLIKIWNYI